MKLLKGLWKLIRTVLLVVLALVLVLVIFAAAGGLGPLVKHVAPPVAKAFGVPLSIEKCVILPFGGYVRLEGVKVDNPSAFVAAKPEMYNQTPLVQIGLFEADVGVRSLFTDEWVVDSLQLTGLRALYAFDLETTNVDALLAQMPQRKAPSAEPTASAAEPTPETEPKESGAPKQFRLAYVHFENNSVSLYKYVTLPIPLPALTLRDIDSTTLRERVMALLEPVSKSIETLGSGVSGLVEGVGTGLNALGNSAAAMGTNTVETLNSGIDALTAAETPEEAEAAVKQTRDELKQSLKELKQDTKDIRKSLKGFLKK